ncbi:uncharacterized protein NPIL_643041 [Nephila pilipes]|uniref:Uncharacterized protein n=1 Tax=Nephila pilipes TaxID=299642 RepID=A0A8X6QU53_NEPPI|nr:uncharacterized protein NPIL_643041 [Nephila pilipes]
MYSLESGPHDENETPIRNSPNCNTAQYEKFSSLSSVFIMSDSKDKSGRRLRSRSAKKKSEDSESVQALMEIDLTDEPMASAAKPVEKDSSAKESSAAQPSGSYGGARPKVHSQIKKKSKKLSRKPETLRATIQRAVLILEGIACSRREEFRANRRARRAERIVARYLGPGWIDTIIQDPVFVPVEGSPIDVLRKHARDILIWDFDRRRENGREDAIPWIPVAHRLCTSRKIILSTAPVECEFEDDFDIELDADLCLSLQIKLPDLSKKDPKPPKKPKSKSDEPPPDAPSGAEEVERREGAGYRGRNVPSYLMIPYNRFSRPERGEGTRRQAFESLEEIYERHGANMWRMYALAAYRTGRYHTEEELRIARGRMDDSNITDETYRDWYHMVRQSPTHIDEDTTIDIPELQSRLISFLITMEKITTAMLYVDIFQDLERRELERRQVEQARRGERGARAATDSEHSDSSPSALGSDIVEDYIRERANVVYRRLVDSEETEGRGSTSEKYPSAVTSGSSTSTIPSEISSPDVISPGESSGRGLEESAKSSISPPSEVSRSDPTSERPLLGSFETTSSTSKSGSFKTASSPGSKPGKLKSRAMSIEKSESFESTSRSISPIPLDTEMSEEESNIQEEHVRSGAQANIMGHVAVTCFLQNIEAAVLEEEVMEEVRAELEESDMEAEPESPKQTESGELTEDKDEQSKRKERKGRDSSETESKRPHMG